MIKSIYMFVCVCFRIFQISGILANLISQFVNANSLEGSKMYCQEKGFILYLMCSTMWEGLKGVTYIVNFIYIQQSIIKIIYPFVEKL